MMCDGTLTFRLLVPPPPKKKKIMKQTQSWLQAASIESILFAVIIIIACGATCQDHFGDRFRGVFSPSALAQYCLRYAQNTIGAPDDGSGVNSDSYEIFMRRWHPHDSSNNGNHERRSWWKRVEVRRRRKSPIFLAFLAVVKTGRKEIIRD